MTRTRTIQVRVSPEEFDQIQRLAGPVPLTGMWLREFLLSRAKAVQTDEPMMAEILALRAIVLNTLATLSPDSAPIIAEFAEKARAKAPRVLQEFMEAR